MAERVINRLEFVKVEHYDLEWTPGAPRTSSLLFETNVKTARIRQASERIGKGIRFRPGVLHRIGKCIRRQSGHALEQAKMVIAVFLELGRINRQGAKQQVVLE